MLADTAPDAAIADGDAAARVERERALADRTAVDAFAARFAAAAHALREVDVRGAIAICSFATRRSVPLGHAFMQLKSSQTTHACCEGTR